MFDFEQNYMLLGSKVKPKITPNQACEAVQLLERLELVKKQKDGTYVQSTTALTSGHDCNSMILHARRAFNRTMIEHALASIETLPVSKRNISGITMALSQSGYDLILAELTAFKERIITIANQDKEFCGVYQFNFQFFPLSDDIRCCNENKKELEKQ